MYATERRWKQPAARLMVNPLARRGYHRKGARALVNQELRDFVDATGWMLLDAGSLGRGWPGL